MILYHTQRIYREGGLFYGAQAVPRSMKELVQPYITSESSYNPKNKTVTGLRMPEDMDPAARGLGFGADKDGFFVHSHRARCKSSQDPLKITKKSISFINSTC